MIISKELMKYVLGYKVSEIHIEDNNICFWKEDDTHDTVLNMDTIARKCKERCWEDGYSLQTRFMGESSTCTIIDRYKDDGFVVHILMEDSKYIEAKATEWVYEKIKNQKEEK